MSDTAMITCALTGVLTDPARHPVPMTPQEMAAPIAIGRDEVWDLHRATAELRGGLRTGSEDTFYLPNADRASSNGDLIAALATLARAAGRTVASLQQARAILGLGAAVNG